MEVFFKRVNLGCTLTPHEARSHGAATSIPRTYNLARTRELRLHSPMVTCVKQTPNEDRPLLINRRQPRYHISRSRDVGAGVQPRRRDTRVPTAHHFHHAATGRARLQHVKYRALPPLYRALVLTQTLSTGTLFGKLWNCGRATDIQPTCSQHPDLQCASRPPGASRDGIRQRQRLAEGTHASRGEGRARSRRKPRWRARA